MPTEYSSKNILQSLSILNPELALLIQDKCIFFEQTDSTNTQAKILLSQNKANLNGTILVANSQTAGRGRLGRSFFSPQDTGIYLSVIFSTIQDLYENDATLITPKAAVAVCHTIEKFSSNKCQIKWVNDIFIQKKKVCGILTEGNINTSKKIIDYAIIGIGINIQPSKKEIPQELINIVGNAELFELDKNNFIATLLSNLFEVLKKENDKSVMDEYRNRSLVLNKIVTVISSTEKFEAKILNITEKGHLIIQRTQNNPQNLTEEIFTGEVSIRM